MPGSSKTGTGARGGGEMGPRAALGVGAPLAADPSGTRRGAHTGAGTLGTEQDGGCIHAGAAGTRRAYRWGAIQTGC